MTEDRQTIAAAASFEGIGLHTGAEVQLRFLPAEPESGIVFQRVDLSDRPRIPARVEHVDRTQPRRTVLRENEAEVQTVEHLLAACNGLGIDDLLVEIDGSEVPGGDGSAQEFVSILSSAPLRSQAVSRSKIKVEHVGPVGGGDQDDALVRSRSHPSPPAAD